MDIKLKSIIKKVNIGICLYLTAAVAAGFYSGMHVYRKWYYIVKAWMSGDNFKFLYSIGGLLFLTAVCIYILRVPRSSWKDLPRFRLDCISPEVLAVTGAAAWGIKCYGVCTAYNSGFIFHAVWVATRWKITVVTCVIFIPLILYSFGCIVLLIRKILMGTLTEQSFIWHWIRNSIVDITFKERMGVVNRTGFMLATVCLAGSLLGGYGIARKEYSFGIVLLAVSVMVMYALYVSLHDDMIRIVTQIRAMADGTLDVPGMEGNTSALAKASQELCTIGENLQEIMKKQMQAERMKIDLITNVSHDLKTPLTSMVGYVDLLKKEPLTKEAADYAEVISVKQEQLKNMIQDIFDLSKSTSGTVKLELEELDMKKLLEQTLADMEDTVQKSGMVVRTRIPEENLRLIGDGKKLYRIIQNLVGNALKYSLKGTRIFIEAEKIETQIVVTVKNTAAYEMDFTPEDIMERFTRADKSRNTDGHGLGLAIADGFTRNMGGELNIEIDGDQFKAIIRFPGLQILTDN